MASFKVHGGDFGKGSGSLLFGQLSLPNGGWSSETFQASQLVAVDAITQANKKKLVGMAGMGALGGVLLGPVGVIGGMLLGGNKTDVGFVAELSDGRSFIGTADQATFLKLKGSATPRRTRTEAPPASLPTTPVLPRLASSVAPQNASGAAAQIIRALQAVSWTVTDHPKRPGKRFSMVHAVGLGRSVAVAFSDDQLGAYNLQLMNNELVGLDTSALRIAVGKGIGGDVPEAATRLAISVGSVAEAQQLVEDAMVGRPPSTGKKSARS